MDHQSKVLLGLALPLNSLLMGKEPPDQPIGRSEVNWYDKLSYWTPQTPYDPYAPGNQSIVSRVVVRVSNVVCIVHFLPSMSAGMEVAAYMAFTNSKFYTKSYLWSDFLSA
jgi:hypothetical protein